VPPNLGLTGQPVAAIIPSDSFVARIDRARQDLCPLKVMTDRVYVGDGCYLPDPPWQ
jgi:hypothetical protein